MDYYPIHGKKIAFHLKPTTIGNYERLRKLSLRSNTTPIISKLEVVREFKLPENDEADELGIKDYFKELYLALFLESTQNADVDCDILDMGVINTAIKDFFTMLKGN